jgi:hypothetical protein
MNEPRHTCWSCGGQSLDGTLGELLFGLYRTKIVDYGNLTAKETFQPVGTLRLYTCGECDGKWRLADLKAALLN